MKTVAINGSNSNASINGILLNHAISQYREGVKFLDLTEYDIPIYSINLEKENGIPESVQNLAENLSGYDKVIISSPEHNSLMPAFFKNILDWLSRTGVKYFDNSRIILLSTSPGNGGGKNALTVLEKIVPYAGGEVVGTFSLPRFSENFSNDRIVDSDLDIQFQELLIKL